MGMRYLTYVLVLLIWAGTAAYANSSNYAQVKDETTLYYEESGSGQTIIFIPGWTFSHEVFDRQVDYFSKKYRVITIDPRSQGRSPVTLENNYYDQHGKDLANLIDKLQLKHVILVGWSAGCFDAYAYIREKGTSNLKAFVCIDASPIANGGDKAWKAPASLHNGADVMRQLQHNRYQFTLEFSQGMVDHKLTSHELDWIARQSLQTPTYVALLLLFDSVNANYQQEVMLLDKSGIPTLNVVSKPMGENATVWLKANAPHSKIVIFGERHMMFWEHAEQFNKILNSFLTSSGV
ncbi:MAG: alpha/beta hydrolase [Gammaproteobacteria bacterium]|nr:alpha/beta hydrolase [Gammaproteobacteria bacterium]